MSKQILKIGIEDINPEMEGINIVLKTTLKGTNDKLDVVFTPEALEKLSDHYRNIIYKPK